MIYLYGLFFAPTNAKLNEMKYSRVFGPLSLPPITINLYRIKAVESSLEKFTLPPRQVSFPLPLLLLLPPPLLDFPRRESVCFRGRFVIQLFPRAEEEEERKRGERRRS